MKAKIHEKLPLKHGCPPPCPGCAHRQWTKKESLEQKQTFLQKILHEWEYALKPVLSLEESKRWGYRKQMVLHTQWTNKWIYGLKKKDHVIPIPLCPVHNPTLNDILQIIFASLPPKNEFPLTYVMVSGKHMTLILKSPSMPPIDWLTPSLKLQLSKLGLEGFWIHLHPSTGKKVVGKGPLLKVFGLDWSRDEDDMWYGPISFQQALPELYREALEMAKRFLKPSEKTAVLDLYCGRGKSAQLWLQAGASVMGVEWSGEAVICAKKNNPEMKILQGLCKDRIPQAREWINHNQNEGMDILLYLNPPRTGLEKEVAEYIAKNAHAKRIAYLSCSPGTLQRDLNILCQAGFRVEILQPYDFFPQTRHVECLALLSK